jgi:dienelactone hydrolase
MENPVSIQVHQVQIQAGEIFLGGELVIPREKTSGLVIFAHGSGSSRFSSRNRLVAETLNRVGLATLLFDLLTPSEHEIDQQTRHLRFNIELLANRLIDTVDWVKQQPKLQQLRLGLFGASTGAAAALVAAAERPSLISAVVSRGGRPDLARESLARVVAPILFIVGGHDMSVIELNLQAIRSLQTEYRLEIVSGATHLFEEPGKLEEVAQLAGEWFEQHLSSRRVEIP